MTFTITAPKAISLTSKSLTRLSYTSLPKKTSFLSQQKTIELRYGIRKNRKANERSSAHFVSSCLKDGSVSAFNSSSNPPREMIVKFYKCINEKNMKELSTYLSQDCLIEDSLFIQPFIGKKAAVKFFEELTQSMGPDVKFRIDSVYERGTSGAGAIWHLEWKNIKIPFTKGCTFIEVKNEETITIRKAQIIIEPCFKAGHFILGMMKLITLLLAKYPAIPEWLIKVSEQRWVMWISKIFMILLKLILNSFLKSYLTFIQCGAQLYILALKLVHFILDFFK